MALSVVDAHVRERLIWLRQQQEDMTILLSQVSTACLHCEKTLQQVGDSHLVNSQYWNFLGGKFLENLDQIRLKTINILIVI